jgi:broad specificity phosphatase PhoE
MKLTVVRHGETTHNAKKINMGHGHGKLSALGKKQAQALGKELKKRKFDFIYCSDLKRCKDTLKEIAKFHKHIPVVFTEQLRERNVGIYEGRSRAEMDQVFEKYRGPAENFKPKGGESVGEHKDRVRTFIEYLKKNHAKDRVLLVTHGGVLRSAAVILQKIPMSKLYRKVTFYNTAINEYEVKGKKTKVLSFNDVAHLNKKPTRSWMDCSALNRFL